MARRRGSGRDGHAASTRARSGSATGTSGGTSVEGKGTEMPCFSAVDGDRLSVSKTDIPE
ncbi:hypothetical protein FTUN_0037 [Frigoriglobus tundricola]|uniref:Uncharacterized protein n=1 Tax=Frigoriglobus tundricola TaxID=2774151 RepID=A0A6M5YGR7_9BACT|nr:hypothetical protein FTUN_0037 [Frigoriglobus tundricola]